MQDFEHLRVSAGDGIARLRLNRPERLNAMNRRMNAEVQVALDRLAADPQVRVIVLEGAGRAFCSGGDLFEHRDFAGDAFEQEMQVHTRIIRAMLDCPKPIICRLHGAAAGRGATFALFSDMVIAAEDARIHDPHVALGLSTGDGAAIVWPFLMGHAHAMQYLLTGDTMTGRQAADYGLVNEAVPAVLNCSEHSAGSAMTYTGARFRACSSAGLA